MIEPGFEKTGEKNIINDLKVQHAQEIKMLRQKNVENESKLIRDLEANYADLELRHVQEIQKTQRDHLSMTGELVMALLRTKSERDRVFLTVSWIAIGTIVACCSRGLMNGLFAKVFTFAGLAGFIGAVVFIKKDLDRNTKDLKFAMEGTVPPDLAWKDDDGRPLRFMIIGLVSSVFLGLTLFINTSKNEDGQPQAPVPSVQQTAVEQSEKPGVTESKPVMPSTKESPSSSAEKSQAATSTGKGNEKAPHNKPLNPATSTVMTAGNGGNFVGGSSAK